MSEHPARKAALLSREYVRNHNREGWLGLFAEDGIIEDPIGVSYLDATGEGHKTPAARAAFWDNNIANTDVTMTIHQSYASGQEVANHVTLDMVFEMEGRKHSQMINGIFTYKVNDEGKLLSLRGYWDLVDAAKTIKALE